MCAEQEGAGDKQLARLRVVLTAGQGGSVDPQALAKATAAALALPAGAVSVCALDETVLAPPA